MSVEVIQYQTEGVCCALMQVAIDDDTIVDAQFLGGCNGNLKAIAKILDGATVEDIEKKLLGNTCGNRPTSCADQLAQAVRKAYEEQGV